MMMTQITGSGDRAWEGVTRRYLLRAGSLALVGLSLPEVLRAQIHGTASSKRRQAKSCILVFLDGGPVHQALWDMKPEAPAEIRGEFKPISTSVPNVQLCEHLPLLARQMDHVALVRSVSHPVVDHNAAAYLTFTGRSPVIGGRLIRGDAPSDFPPFGSVLVRLRPVDRPVPGFVHLPEIASNIGKDLPGQRAGFLGAAYQPFVAGDPSAPDYKVPGLELQPEVSLDRLGQRRALLDDVDRTLGMMAELPAIEDMSSHQRKAFMLLAAPDARRAFDLNQEPQKVRARYGLPDRTDRSLGARQFGGLPHLGQCMLLARRLIESGVRLVTVCTGRRFDQCWDTHWDEHGLLKQSLLPYFDRAFSALIEDLSDRGMLDETLVVAMGEFGRTRSINKRGGRDHWPRCYTVLMAGGGIRGGAVYGQSDAFAAAPVRDPVSPVDIATTIYYAMGISRETHIQDHLGQTHQLALGRPIFKLFG